MKFSGTFYVNNYLAKITGHNGEDYKRALVEPRVIGFKKNRFEVEIEVKPGHEALYEFRVNGLNKYILATKVGVFEIRPESAKTFARKLHLWGFSRTLKECEQGLEFNLVVDTIHIPVWNKDSIKVDFITMEKYPSGAVKIMTHDNPTKLDRDDMKKFLVYDPNRYMSDEDTNSMAEFLGFDTVFIPFED